MSKHFDLAKYFTPETLEAATKFRHVEDMWPEHPRQFVEGLPLTFRPPMDYRHYLDALREDLESRFKEFDVQVGLKCSTPQHQFSGIKNSLNVQFTPGKGRGVPFQASIDLQMFDNNSVQEACYEMSKRIEHLMKDAITESIERYGANMNEMKETFLKFFGELDPADNITKMIHEPAMSTIGGGELVVTFRVPHEFEKRASFGQNRRKDVIINDLKNSNRALLDENVNLKSRVAACLNTMRCPEVQTVIYSGDRTIVLWKDGTKTMVKKGEGETYDEYTAFCACVVKKMFGDSTSRAKKFLKAHRAPDKKPKSKKKESSDGEAK